MKAKFITAIIGTALLLTACGGGHGPKAVDKLAEAQTIALEKAPKAQEVKFEDEGQPTIGGVGGTKNANANNPADSAEHIANDIATANAQAVAHHGQADTATTEETPKADNTATATAEPASTETKTDEVANPNTNTEAPKTENAENADTKQQ